MKREYVFWQRSLSPHMAGLACALADRGAAVSVCALESLSARRANQGWTVPAMRGVRVEFIGRGSTPERLVDQYPPGAIHIAEGLRRNGELARVEECLRSRARHWGVIMETVNDRTLLGVLKRLDYRWAFSRLRPEFVLAIGRTTAGWIAGRGVREDRIYPFTYFLAPLSTAEAGHGIGGGSEFRVGFVGNLVQGKRVDLLLSALDQLVGADVTLVVVGDGPMATPLRERAQSSGRYSVEWNGRVPMAEVHKLMASLDCLVLPSDHDGWGAVVSEALMSGVPAVCSDRCGAAEAVLASGVGGVFPAGDSGALSALLRRRIELGRPTQSDRLQLSRWAQSLCGAAGAEYLDRIVDHVLGASSREPKAPWLS